MLISWSLSFGSPRVPGILLTTKIRCKYYAIISLLRNRFSRSEHNGPAYRPTFAGTKG